MILKGGKYVHKIIYRLYVIRKVAIYKRMIFHMATSFSLSAF